VSRFSDHIRPTYESLVPKRVRDALWCFRVRRAVARMPLRVPPPDSVTIDPIAVCNLRCPLCATGRGQINFPVKVMAFDVFERVVEALPQSVKRVELYNWGEPLLHPRLSDMVRHLRARGCAVNLDTNLCVRKPREFFEDLLDAGPTRLTISLDGATPESYLRYRVGGDFHLVLRNLRTLASIERTTRDRATEVVWKFVVNRFNESEIEVARGMAAKMGVALEFAPMGMGDDLPDLPESIAAVRQRMAEWLPRGHTEYVHEYYAKRYAWPLSPLSCQALFSYCVVNPDGTVSPCCYCARSASAFGSLLDESFEAIWNGDRYRHSRSLFTRAKYHGPRVKTICDGCRVFRRRR